MAALTERKVAEGVVQGREELSLLPEQRRGWSLMTSSVLAQRAASEDPRWTRAVGDYLASPQGKGQDWHGERLAGRSRSTMRGKFKKRPQ